MAIPDVYVICALQYSGHDEKPYQFVPFATMFSDNPYENLIPPTKESP